MKVISGFAIIAGLVGLIMLATGLYTQRKPPAKINPIYGYRTRRSRINQDTWDFAQLYSAKVMIKSGIFLVVLAALGFALRIPAHKAWYFAGIFISLFVPMLTVFYTESALKRTFDEQGNRRS